jgi:hypothetical protein
MPVIRFGRLLRVPVAPLEEKLGVPPGTIEQMLADNPALAAMAGVVIDIADSDSARSRATIIRKPAGEESRHQRRARGEADAARTAP